jgi:sulfur carrier protein
MNAIHITLNGDCLQFDSEITVADLLDRLALQGKRIAVELNQEIVPKSTFTHTFLKQGDKLEIVHAIGGG